MEIIDDINYFYYFNCIDWCNDEFKKLINPNLVIHKKTNAEYSKSEKDIISETAFKIRKSD